MTKDEVKRIQSQLNKVVAPTPRLVEDGIWGNSTAGVLKTFQKNVGIVPDGIYGPITEGALFPAIASLEGLVPVSDIASKKVTEKDIKDSADFLGCEVAALKAVMKVEARNSGFLKDGRCVILFERHIFYREYAKKHGDVKAAELAVIHPGIINKATGGYIGNEAEWDRMAAAVRLDEECAYLSASWGLGQVMGFNYEPAGYKDVFTFVADMKATEGKQLQAMASFIKANPSMNRALVSKDWASFARAYNGPAYAKNQYDVKLDAAYKSFK